MIEQGTYEILRERLLASGKQLATKADALNKRRIEVFGGYEMALLGSDRIRTENNCVPRDIVEAGGLLVFGYNVFIGLKTETLVSDVFSVHRIEDFAPVAAPFLQDEKFAHDFRELYQYYRNSRLLQLRRVDSKLLAVFQTSDKLTDIRVFRWNIAVDGTITYIDNRGERDHVFPPRHDFEWTATTREDYVAGKFPHVSIHDEVFVETLHGDVTIKIEDNTETGRGIYSEPVDDPDQSLDDAQIHYAIVGSLILLKILPYREKNWRYFIFNRRTKSVKRVDAIGHACIQLPEDHGIIFPGGYTLRTGETKLFDHDPTEMELLRTVRSPNGEDVLYVFHRRDEGRTLMLPYNLIRKEVVNPLTVHGWSLFPDGKLVVFQSISTEPTRVHAMQIWQTPFVSDDHLAKKPATGSYLEKIGNRDLVRGLSSALSLCRLIDEQTPSRATYEDLVTAAVRSIDAYYWYGHAEAQDLLTPVKEIRATAELIIDEFEKVEALKAQAAKAVEGVAQTLARPIDLVAKTIDDHVAVLADLRKSQGHVISMRELRYVDRARLDGLEAEIVERFGAASKATVDYLTNEKALAPFAEKIASIESRILNVAKTPEAEALVSELETVVASLNLLTEILGGLQIDDPTVRIAILDRISALMSAANRVRALVAQRRKDLLGKERVAEFAVQFQLFAQTVTNAVAVADTPERCDAELAKLMLQLEELESRFSEFDDFVAQLATKREEVYEALTARKQSLIDQRQRRAEQLNAAATRILQGIARRAQAMHDTDALNAFFAGDAMVAKLRETSKKLRDLGDIVRADEIDGRLKTARDEAARTMRDRGDLFEDAGNVLRFGEYRFSVNTQATELTIVPRDGVPHLHITGTGFFEPAPDVELWDQELVSETKDVYRGEYLAYTAMNEDIRAVAASRYDEGYERGVHDHDAMLIADKVRAMLSTAGLLRYTPTARAAAAIFWAYFEDEALKKQWAIQAQALDNAVMLSRADGEAPPSQERRGSFAALRMTDELQTAIAKWLPIDLGNIHGAGEYLFEEIAQEPIRFIQSVEAKSDIDIRPLDLPRKWAVIHAHVPDIEAAATIVTNGILSREHSSAITKAEVKGLLGQHPRIVHGTMTIELDEFLARLGRFTTDRVPAFRAYQQNRSALLERERKRLRLHELQPKVMAAFVRNKLISEVYLPLIGANLAKQMGVA
ncbi:MAG: DNA repair ATPase, partial [Thermoanaerobaculia bacterium]